MRRAYTCTLITLLLIGCASGTVPKATVAEDGVCSVFVYRNKTSFHIVNPEKPFLYVDGVSAGKLVIGESLCLNIGQGSHTLTVKEPVLFMPAYENGRLEVQVQSSASPTYVRYSKEFSGAVMASGYPLANTRLAVVTKADWEERR